MSHSKKILALFVVAVSAALATSLFHSEEATARDRGSIKAGRIDAQLTRLQVDVFELICPRERLIDLDLAEINRGNGARSATGQTAASAREVLDRLRQFGDARPAIHYDNFVHITAGTSITSGADMPIVTDITLSGSGVVTPSVSYDTQGFELQAEGQWLELSEPSMAHIGVSVQAAEPLDDPRTISDGVALPQFRRFQSEQRIVARSGLPILLTCNDTTAPENNDDQVKMLVVRLVATRLIE